MKTIYTIALSALAGAAIGAAGIQTLHAQVKPPVLVALTLIFFGVALPASGQQLSASDEGVMKARQALTDNYAAAISAKDMKAIAAAVANLYTDDAVIKSLCPEASRAFGRDLYLKRLGAP